MSDTPLSDQAFAALSSSFFSVASSLPLASERSLCSSLMYSIAISTVLALLFDAAWPAVCAPAPPPDSAPLPADVSLSLPPFATAAGSRLAISCRALLMRLRRPCSAILCEVRFELMLVESASG